MNSELIKSNLYKYSAGGITTENIQTQVAYPSSVQPLNQVPTIYIVSFGPGQNGEYVPKGRFPNEMSVPNTIRMNIDLIQNFEDKMNDTNSSEKERQIALMAVLYTLTDEYTHWGDGQDGIDANLIDGKIVNDPAFPDADFIKNTSLEEGNECKSQIFYFPQPEKMYELAKLGAVLIPKTGKNGKPLIGTDGKLILQKQTIEGRIAQPSIIPTLPDKSPNPIPKKETPKPSNKGVSKKK